MCDVPSLKTHGVTVALVPQKIHTMRYGRVRNLIAFGLTRSYGVFEAQSNFKISRKLSHGLSAKDNILTCLLPRFGLFGLNGTMSDSINQNAPSIRYPKLLETLVEFWAGQITLIAQFHSSVHHNCRWKAPPSELVTINYDRVIFPNFNKAGIVVVIKDS